MALTDSSEVLNRLSREIADFPDRATAAARQGFEIINGLSETDRAKAVELMFSSFERGGGSIDTELLSNEIPSLTRRDAGRVMTALSFSFALLTENAVTAAEFVRAGSGKIFDTGYEPTAAGIADIVINRRAALDKAITRNQLANAILPSLARFDVTVDLRIRFEKEKAQEFVPVALAHIDTDADNTEFWFQMSRADITMLLEKLNKCLREMELAEELLNKAIVTDQ
jgi:hypothetical protein